MNNLTATLAMMAPAPGQDQGSPMGMLVPMILIFGIFYFIAIRPQQRKEKERRKMIEGAKSGDRVLFSGGIMGTVTNVKDKTLVIKIADNVKIEVARGGVNRVLREGENPDLGDK